jgi:hypothetical protein
LSGGREDGRDGGRNKGGYGNIESIRLVRRRTMIRKLNKAQKRALEEKNRRFLLAHPDYYKEQPNDDPDTEHAAEGVEDIRKGKKNYGV